MGLAAAPAHASSGSVRASDGVLYKTCRDHAFTYDLDIASGFEHDVSIDTTAYGPDGEAEAIDFDFDIAGSGTGALLFCGYEMPGRYTLESKVEACNEEYDCYTFTVSSSFTMRAPATRTTLAVKPAKPRRNALVRITVRSSDERPNGYFATDGARVVLQTRKGNKWVAVKGGKVFAWDGKAVIKQRWKKAGRVQLRATTLASSTGTASVSKVVTLRVR